MKPSANLFSLIQKLIRENLKNQDDLETVEKLNKALKEVDQFDDEADLLANAPRLSSLINFNNFRLPASIDVNDLESDNFLSFIETLPELKKTVEAKIEAKKNDQEDKSSDTESDTMSESEAPIIPASYRRLSSSVIVPYQQLVASRNSKKVEVVEEEENENENDSEDNPLKFLADYDSLLHRQQAIQNMANGHDLDQTVSKSEVARFSLDKLLDIVWNLFIHIKIMYEEVVPESLAKEVYEVISK